MTVVPSPKEEARRIVVHDPTGFSSLSEAHGWPAVFPGRYSVLPGDARLLHLLL